jgi:hypothetical protein
MGDSPKEGTTLHPTTAAEMDKILAKMNGG